jgi:hypothetical protein
MGQTLRKVDRGDTAGAPDGPSSTLGVRVTVLEGAQREKVV